MSFNFAIVGCAGYVAPRHMEAIKNTGNKLIAALDPHDSVGILDSYSDEVRYFPEVERFERHVEKLRRMDKASHVHYISICSPNYLHEPHVRNALKMGAHVICEKPVALDPKNIENLKVVEKETNRKVYTVFQLRYHPRIIELKKKIELNKRDKKYDVVLTYISPRGPWYHYSWKGKVELSGGLATNIGIHLFEILLWLFGEVEDIELHISNEQKVAGYLKMQKANVKWFLSIDKTDLPKSEKTEKDKNSRIMEVNSNPDYRIDFSGQIDNLHDIVYEEIIAGRGLGLDIAKPSIDLVYKIRHIATSIINDNAHPFMLNKAILSKTTDYLP